MRQFAIRFVVCMVRLYLSRMPFYTGKRFIWQKVVVPYLLWRKIKAKTRTRFGSLMDVDIRDSIQRFVYFFGIFEPVITEYVVNSLRPGDVFIDVGANVGYYSLLASKRVGPTGKVFAFEASSSIFEMLKENLRANQVTNVVTFNVAVTATPCDVKVYKHDCSNLGGTTISPTVASRRSTIDEGSVKGLPLPSILEPEVIRRARLIKVDVEGSEWGVLVGLRHLLPLLSERTEILLELDREALADQDVNIKEFFDMFAAAGFEGSLVANEYNEEFYFSRKKMVSFRGKDVDEALPKLTDWIFRRRELPLPQ